MTKIFCRVAQNTRLMDKPNERSMHIKPTVRGGGIVFVGLSLFALAMFCFVTKTYSIELIISFICIFLLASISFLDDLYHLTAKIRFIVQFIIAAIISLFLCPDSLDFVVFTFANSYLIVIFVFFAVIWAINHFNFMDGLDGYCASQAVFLFAAYALLFGEFNAPLYQSYCCILIACVSGFLIFNLPPAKLFMGDVGSTFLGLTTFCLALIGQQKYQIPIFYWFSLNALFLFDATITLFRRIVKKEKWSSPHKKHAYQRLKQFGIGTRTILFGQFLFNAYFVMLLLLFYFNKLNLTLLLILQIGTILLLYYFVEKLFPMFDTRKKLIA